MLAAEKSCCRAKTGYACLLKFVKAGKLVQYWKMRKSSLRNKVDLDQLIHLAKLYEVEDDPTTTLEVVDRKLTEARKQLKT
eukprot:9488766-Ditylum_brightwellii.AAC.1